MARARQTPLLLTIALLVLTSDGSWATITTETSVVLPDKCITTIIGRGNACVSTVCPAVCAKDKGRDGRCVPEGCSCTFCFPSLIANKGLTDRS